MTLINVAKLLNNAASITAIFLCLAVVFYWGRSLIRSAYASGRGFRISAESWFVVGVFITHLSDVLDGTFWTWTWHNDLYQTAATAELMESGPLLNLFARQLLIGLGAYCHIHSYNLQRQRSHNTHKILQVAALLGGIYLIIGFCTAPVEFFIDWRALQP